MTVLTAPKVVDSAALRLVRTELRLVRRDPLVLTFVLVFPIVTMLIIGGAFGTDPDPAFAGQNPSHWYVASYFTVVIASTGLVMLPVHLAAYRERGVIRRFAAAGLPALVVRVGRDGHRPGHDRGGRRCSFSSWPRRSTASRRCTTRGGCSPDSVFGSIGFVSIGVLLGSLLPSARAAQAVGLMLFFPSFLLGAGGPPPHVMGSALRHVADVLPLTWVTKSIREPWLGIGTATPALIAVSGARRRGDICRGARARPCKCRY